MVDALVALASVMVGGLGGFVVANRRIPRTLSAMTAEQWRVLAGKVAQLRSTTAPAAVVQQRAAEDPEEERRRNERRQALHDQAIAEVRKKAAMSRA